MANKLSIVITSYNRPDALRRQLDSLMNQNIEAVEQILVIDNCSDFDVNAIVNSYNEEKIIAIKNKANIGGAVNIIFPLLFGQTEWVWTLSDDDVAEPSSIELILERITNVPESVCAIKFSRVGVENKEYHALCVEDLIDYYLRQRPALKNGDFYFISTNVFRVNKLKEFLFIAFNYATTGQGHLLPMLYAMKKNRSTVLLAPEKVVKYCSPEEGDKWGHIKHFGQFSIVSLICLELDKKYHKKFLDLMTVIPYRDALHYTVCNFNSESKFKFDLSYQNLYKINFSVFMRMRHKIIVTLISFCFFRSLLLYIGRRMYRKLSVT